METKDIEEKIIYGISIKTTNKNETNPKTAKIEKMFKEFDKNIEVDYKGGQRVYGVYYDYKPDENGEFCVLAGCESFDEKLQSVKIKKGKYLVFSKTFEENSDKVRIQAIIKTWKKIWKYFSNENSKYKRAYKTDFEYYKNRNEIEVYISIK